MPPWMYADLKPCGTTAAYDRHIRRGEPACRPCREANARRWREQNQPKRKPAPPKRTVQDPAAELAARIDAAAGPGTASRWLLDICEAIEGPPWEFYREAQEEAS